MSKKYIMLFMVAISCMNNVFGSLTSERSHQNELLTRLFRAAIEQDRGTVRTLLGQGVDINAIFGGGCTALQDTVAQRDSHPEFIKFMIEQGSDVNACDNEGQTAMHDAAFLGYQARARILLEYGADLDVEDKQGVTPLCRALLGGKLELVQFLLQAGAMTILNNSKSILDFYLDHLKSKSMAPVEEVEKDTGDTYLDISDDEEEVVHPGKLRRHLSEMRDEVKSVLVFLYLYGIPKTEAWHYLLDNVPGLRQRVNREASARNAALTEGLNKWLSARHLQEHLLSYAF